MTWKSNTFLLRKGSKYLELPLCLFVAGVRDVKSVLLKLHPEHENMILNTFKSVLMTIHLFSQRKRYITVVSQSLDPTILNDKSIFSDTSTLISLWSATSVKNIPLKKEIKPFWNDKCEEISTELWLPKETTQETKLLNSLCSTTINTNTHKPSYLAISRKKNIDTMIRSRKVRLYPTPKQKDVMNQWIGTSRYVYNKVLDAVKKGEKIDEYGLRNKYVTHLYKVDCIADFYMVNDNVKEWEMETPKDIRQGVIRDLKGAYKTAMTNLKQGNIKKFNLGYRSKRKDSSIEIPHSAISLENKELFIYKSRISDKIKMSNDKCLSTLKINYNCRLKKECDKWFLFVPCEVEVKSTPKNKICSLDPGVRKFQTVYSENKTVKYEVNTKLINKLKDKISLFQELRSRGIISRKALNRRRNKINFKLKCLVDDLHYRIISDLTSSYSVIFLPEFESQELVQKIRFKTTRDRLLLLGHYKFKQRLKEKCASTGSSCVICTEEYTSKTCGRCGVINEIGMSEVFSCCNCNLVIDRDINGARNILIKNLKERV